MLSIKFLISLICIFYIFFKSFVSKIFVINDLKETVKILSRYLSLVKFIFIIPLTSILLTLNTLSSERVFVNDVHKKIVAVKKIKIYSFNEIV